MSVTLGLMLRIDSAPVAVAIPPLPQSLQPAHPIIEATKVIEPTSTARSQAFHREHALTSHHSAAMKQSPLTYSRQGSAGASAHALKGQLLNIYA